MLASLFLAAVLAPATRAEDFSGRWGAGVDAGFASGLGAEAVDDTTGNGDVLGISILRGLTPHWRAGLNYENMELGQIRFQPTTLSATYAWTPDSLWTPIAEIGGGIGRADHLTRGGGGETSLALKGALGVEYSFTPSLTGSARATLYNSGHTAGSNDHQINAAGFSVGLTLWFGEPKARYVRFLQAPPAPAPAPAPAPTPAPAPPPVPAPMPEPTLKHTVSVRLDVQFESGKAIVRDAYAGNLAEVGTFLQSHPTVRAEIEGHSDSTGSAAQNTRLSQRRAENVRLYLIGHYGIDGSRLSAKGYGPARPVADNATEEGRAQNRRVVAVLEAQE